MEVPTCHSSTTLLIFSSSKSSHNNVSFWGRADLELQHLMEGFGDTLLALMASKYPSGIRLPNVCFGQLDGLHFDYPAWYWFLTQAGSHLEDKIHESSNF